VISEVRRAKTAVAQQYGFDVIAMVRALRRIDEEENAEKAEHSLGNCTELKSGAGDN